MVEKEEKEIIERAQKLKDDKEQEKLPEEKPQPLTMIEDAHSAAQELKEQNDRIEENIKKLEKLRSFEMLGGASAGAPQEEPKKEMTDKEYAQSVMKGEIPLLPEKKE